jgi:hypothetical protein
MYFVAGMQQILCDAPTTQHSYGASFHGIIGDFAVFAGYIDVDV